MTRAGRPRVVAFYSYKGGTGRSFALAHTAWALAREGRRIVMIDLDLGAPSLWGMFPPLHEAQAGPGLIEYLREWRGGGAPKAEDFLHEVRLDSRAKGALFLLPAGRQDASYLETYESLDWHAVVQAVPVYDRLQATVAESAPSLFPGRVNPRGHGFFDRLFDSITATLAPDAIFLDAPTGFTETANLVVRMLSDLTVVLFAPTRVHLDGVSRLVALITSEQMGSDGETSRVPDLFTVASTLMISRFGSGRHIDRVRAALDELARRRYQALGAPETLTTETEDRIYPEHAIVRYDDRIAELEVLPTTEEPAPNYFAVYDDVIKYVGESLPGPPTQVPLAATDKEPILRALEGPLGSVAEAELATRLDDFFLETSFVEEVANPGVVVICGRKGAGKTALFLRTLSRTPGAIRVHGAGTGLSADVLTEIVERAPQRLDVFWRLYLLSRVTVDSTRFEVQPEDPNRRALESLRQMEADPRVVGRFVEQLHREGAGPDVDAGLRRLDEQLESEERGLLLCLDGLDSAFKADASRRKRGLEGLFVGWQASFPTLRRIKLKVFLRTDLWESLTFPEKSHLLGAVRTIAWDKTSIWRMVVKRALNAAPFRDYAERALPRPHLDPQSVESASDRAMHPYLDRLFENTIWAGKTALSRNWIDRRLRDAKDAVYPRDVLVLFHKAVDVERERMKGEKRLSSESVLSRESLSMALTPCSEQRVQAVLEESPELGPVLDALRERPSQGEFYTLRDVLSATEIGMTADAAIDRLTESGILGRAKDVEPGAYVVPDLYRHGLKMTRKGPR